MSPGFILLFRAVSPLAVALTMLVAPLAAQSVDSGMVVRVAIARSGAERSSSKRFPHDGMLITRRGPRQRVDLLSADTDSARRDWIVIDDTARAMWLHEAREHRTMVMRMRDLSLMFTDLLHATMDSVTESVVLLGPGERILGYPTQRVRITQSFRVRTETAGKSQVVRAQTETVAHIARDLPASLGANSVLSLTASSGAAFLKDVLAPVMSGALRRTGPPIPGGLALRSVSRMHATTVGDVSNPMVGAGESVSMDSIEVVSVAPAAVPDSVFAPPRGFTQLDLAQEMRKLIAMVKELGEGMAGGTGRNRPKPVGKPPMPRKP